MKEYELVLKIKNAPLLNVMRTRGIRNAAELSRAVDINQGTLGKFLNLSKAPYSRQGKLLDSVKTLEKFFGLTVDFLFPYDELYIPLERNTFTAQMCKEEMLSISSECPSKCLEMLENESDKDFNGMLENTNLTSREKRALKLKFIDNMTLTNIGKNIGTEDCPYNVTGARARQILLKAVHKLKKERNVLIEEAGVYNKVFKNID